MSIISIAWKKAVYRLGLPKAVINDNGSENMGVFTELLASQPVKHYWARPHTLKDKPHVENLIGKLQQECLDENRVRMNLVEKKQIINWLNDYYFFRPHQALNYLTPAEFCDTLGLTIFRRKVSTMY